MQVIWVLSLLYSLSIATTSRDMSVLQEEETNKMETVQESLTHHVKPAVEIEILHSKENETIKNKVKTTSKNRIPELPTGGVLYPRRSESRDLLSLNGLWSFVLDSSEKGVEEKWFEKDIGKMPDAIMMPVPSSYNDITTNDTVRDHVGLVWYQSNFFVPSSWNFHLRWNRLWLRFGGVHYLATVWVNGEEIVKHEIGQLPFQCDISKLVNFGGKNKLTVSVDNRLGLDTIPQGFLKPIRTARGEKVIQLSHSGFYDYAGINLPVYLYTTPYVYIDDVSLKSEFQSGKVFLLYKMVCKGLKAKEQINASLTVIDKDGVNVGNQLQLITDESTDVSGSVQIDSPKLWWPYLMSPDPGYLYTIEIVAKSISTGATDIYRLPFGFRSVKWTNESLFINDNPVYIRGISKHEDSDIRGRGLDLPTSVRDFNLLKWLGVNTYKTSQCPQAEESMDLAEQMGFMVIDQVPSMATYDFSDDLLLKHKMAVAELINRDKNRACVIMWSVAEEPASELTEAGPYFGSVVEFTREQDNSRPITAILNRWYSVDLAAQRLDVICFNRFNGYFKEPGQWGVSQRAVQDEATFWHQRHHRPVIMSEYGTEALEGLHGLPEFMWSEEFQKRLLSEHFKAFDNLRQNSSWFIGEMVYSFTDYKVLESINRVGDKGRKGVFTRQRQPKSSAFLIRARNFKLAAAMSKDISLQNELELYSA